MKGYIVYSSYRIIGDAPVVILFGRLENGESFRADIPFRPYFYIKEKDLSHAVSVLDTEFEKTDLKDFDSNKVVKVYADIPQNVPAYRKNLEDENIGTYESDIRFVLRYYMDNGILGTIDLSGDHSADMGVDRYYQNPWIRSAKEYDVRLRMLSIDIETDKAAEKVYSIALHGCGIQEVHIVTPAKCDAVRYDDEESLLDGFLKRFEELDPDIVVGWNFIDFDLDVLSRRMKHYKKAFALGRGGDAVRIRKQADFFRDSTADVFGRIVFDGISLLKQAYIRYQDYKLDTVAKEVLGKSKVELEDGFWDNFTDIIKKDPKRVADYNLQDARLVTLILEKLNLIDLNIKKSLITGMQLDRVKQSVASLDSLYIRSAHKRGYVCPNSRHGERGERIKGAYVMKPNPGIYDFVAVLDFKSLYPSIIRTFNIDPIAHRKDGTIVAPNGARFVNDEGILPEIIKKLWKERDIAKKNNDDARSHAIKIIMNSFYGVLANPSCRFYSLEMGNAITSFAREIIKETVSLIRKDGFSVLYGDTDSVFVDLKVSCYDDAKKIGSQIAKKINSHFTKKIREEYGRKSVLELEFEKVFRVLMLPKVRGGEAGAKKRYAGILIKDGKESITVTGMEMVRRDWTDIAKRVQMELLDRVFHKREVSDYIVKIVSDIRAGKFDDELVYRKSLRKNLDEYVKTTPPHVKAARKLPKVTSGIIEYYMTKNGPEPVQMLKSPIDYDHYIEKQIKPIAETILALFDKNFDDVVQNQKSLFDF